MSSNLTSPTIFPASFSTRRTWAGRCNCSAVPEQWSEMNEMYDPDENWPALAMAALRAGIRTVESSSDEVVPSWYIIAKAAVAKYEKEHKPLSEYEDWQYMESGP